VLGPALRWLDLESTRIRSLDLTRATSLQRLHLDNCPLEALPVGLDSCAELETLTLDQASNSEHPSLDLGDLRGLTALRVLSLQGHRRTTLPPVAEPSRLEVLRCSWSPLRTLPEVVGRMTRLRELRARACKLERVPDLSGLTGLRMLDLSSNPLRVLAGLSGHQKLESLWLSGCLALEHLGITDAPENLRSLRLSGVRLGGLPRWVEGLSELEELYLDGTGLTELPCAPGRWPALRSLALEGNQIQDATPLAALKNLRELALERNPVRSLPPLASWPQLRGLSLYRTLLEEVQIEEGAAPWLGDLRLQEAPLRALPRVDFLVSLRELSLDRRLESDPSAPQILQRLRERPWFEGVDWNDRPPRPPGEEGEEGEEAQEEIDDEIPFLEGEGGRLGPGAEGLFRGRRTGRWRGCRCCPGRRRGRHRRRRGCREAHRSGRTGCSRSDPGHTRSSWRSGRRSRR
jgi:Leucine-rich repeat (LRR) protein